MFIANYMNDFMLDNAKSALQTALALEGLFYVQFIIVISASQVLLNFVYTWLTDRSFAMRSPDLINLAIIGYGIYMYDLYQKESEVLQSEAMVPLLD